MELWIVTVIRNDERIILFVTDSELTAKNAVLRHPEACSCEIFNRRLNNPECFCVEDKLSDKPIWKPAKIVRYQVGWSINDGLPLISKGNEFIEIDTPFYTLNTQDSYGNYYTMVCPIDCDDESCQNIMLKAVEEFKKSETYKVETLNTAAEYFVCNDEDPMFLRGYTEVEISEILDRAKVIKQKHENHLTD